MKAQFIPTPSTPEDMALSVGSYLEDIVGAIETGNWHETFNYLWSLGLYLESINPEMDRVNTKGIYRALSELSERKR